MSTALWMHQDVRTWLAGLRSGDPGLARLVGEAVVAFLDAGEVLGPPLVVRLPFVDAEPGSAVLGPAEARERDARLNSRREVAGARTSRSWAELVISQLERQASRLAGQIEEAIQAGREDLAAQARVREASVCEQLADLRHQLLMASAREERAMTAVADLEEKTRQPDGRDGRRSLWKAIALRPGAPGPVRAGLVLLPNPGLAILGAHVCDPGASLDDYYTAASIKIAAVGLPAVPPGPPGSEQAGSGYASYDVESFLDEFFAAERTEIAIGAGALVSRYRLHTLAEARLRTELTQAQVALRMNVRQERVSAIERAEPGAVEVRTLAAYVEALGGRLEVVARIDGERITLSSHP